MVSCGFAMPGSPPLPFGPAATLETGALLGDAAGADVGAAGAVVAGAGEVVGVAPEVVGAAVVDVGEVRPGFALLAT